MELSLYVVRTTTTTLFPELWTWIPPDVQPCFPSISLSCGTSFRSVMSFSPAYFSSYSARTSLARISCLRGAETVEMIPLNHGATVGTNAILNDDGDVDALGTR